MFKIRRRSKADKERKELLQGVHKELEAYITKEDLQKYLSKIEKDEGKRRIWSMLSKQKRLKLLRYVANKKGKDGKK